MKPASMGFTQRDIGRRITFTITGPHVENTQGEGDKARTLRSMPVSYKDGTANVVEGQFPLNKTSLSYLVGALGKNSDSWVKHTFDAVVITQNNPSTSAQVLSWQIIQETIK